MPFQNIFFSKICTGIFQKVIGGEIPGQNKDSFVYPGHSHVTPGCMLVGRSYLDVRRG